MLSVTGVVAVARMHSALHPAARRLVLAVMTVALVLLLHVLGLLRVRHVLALLLLLAHELPVEVGRWPARNARAGVITRVGRRETHSFGVRAVRRIVGARGLSLRVLMNHLR